MAYQTTVTLTDAEYAAFSAEAAKSGKSLELFLHEILLHHIRPSTADMQIPSRQDIQDYLYRAGITEHIPTNELDAQEEARMRKYLADLFGQGKPVSEIVIEDRGTR